jgi:hypothetical protein
MLGFHAAVVTRIRDDYKEREIGKEREKKRLR